MGLLEGRKKHIRSPLEEEYFSTTPYKLGETAVKYSAKPEQSKDYLRDVMVEQLRPRKQPQAHPRRATRRQGSVSTSSPERPIDHADRRPDRPMAVGLGESGDD